MLPPWRLSQRGHDARPLVEAAAHTPTPKGESMTLIGYTEDRFYVPERMAAAITARALGGAIPEPLRPYASTTFPTLAHACLVAARADRPGMSPTTAPGAVVELALSTSDFPRLVSNVFEAVVLDRYRRATPTYSRLTKPVEVSHFKTTPIVYPGDFPAPLEVPESGEVKRGSITESAEEVRLKLYARSASLTLALLSNDDVGGLASLAEAAASRFVDHANALFFSTCLTPSAGMGPTLSDGATFFHANHANATAVGDLGAARALLKEQRTLDGVAVNADAAFLLVAPDAQTFAEELVSKLANASPAGQRLTVLADAALAGSSRFYVFARPSEVAAFAHVSLPNQPSVVSVPGFAYLGVDVRLSAAHAFAALDYRGAVTGATL